MLEILLISFCYNNFNTLPCQQSEMAYYKQSGMERSIFDFSQRIENHYKQYSTEFIIAGTLITIATQHNYTTKVMSIKGVEVFTSIGETNSLTFKKELN